MSVTLTRKKGSGIENPVTGYLFIMPQLVLFIIFILYPIFEGFRMSLYRATYIDEIFVGFENYKILFEDPVFLKSMVNTILFVIGIVFFTIRFFHSSSYRIHFFNCLHTMLNHSFYYLFFSDFTAITRILWICIFLKPNRNTNLDF